MSRQMGYNAAVLPESAFPVFSSLFADFSNPISVILMCFFHIEDWALREAMSLKIHALTGTEQHFQCTQSVPAQGKAKVQHSIVAADSAVCAQPASQGTRQSCEPNAECIRC